MMAVEEGGHGVEPTTSRDLELVGVLQAMGDPQRLALLRVLADGEWHPCGAADLATGLHKSTISVG